MKVGEQGLSIIKHYEKFVSTPYLCPAKKLTIGYGHVILANEKFKAITEEQAVELMQRDLEWVETCIKQCVKIKLTQNQYDALASLIFNIGSGAFASSTLLKFLNLGRLEDAAIQFLRWTRSKGIVLKGLVKRRETESKLFSTGQLELK